MERSHLTVAYLINRKPSRVLTFETSCQVLLNSSPNTIFIPSFLQNIQVYLFVHVHQHHRGKLKELKIMHPLLNPQFSPM